MSRLQTIALNDFIQLRGTSGSSRGATLIANALRENFNVLTLSPPSEPRLKFQRLWKMLDWDFQTAPREAYSADASLIVHPTNTGGRHKTTGSLLIVHDVMPLDHPGIFSRPYTAYFRWAVKASVERASAVVVPSRHTASRLKFYWPKCDPVVIPWAVSLPHQQSIRSLHERGRFGLVVASSDRHKRIPLAIEATSMARRMFDEDLRLIIVTRLVGNAVHDVKQAISRFDPRGNWITVEKDVRDEHLADLYRDSRFLVVPSLDEGFCLPACEAASYGTPVVHAGRGAVPEVVEDTDGQPEARACDDIFTLLSRIRELSNSTTWELRSEAAFRSAQRFSWERFSSAWKSTVVELSK